MLKENLCFLTLFALVVARAAASDVLIPKGNLSSSSMNSLKSARAAILSWAPTFDGSVAQPGCGTPQRFSCDATFWNGLLCSNAKNDTAFACKALARSQTLPDGEFWRSPWEAKARNSTNPDFFSRDQGLALLGSMIQTKNQTMWAAWRAYLASNKGSMCPRFADVGLLFVLRNVSSSYK